MHREESRFNFTLMGSGRVIGTSGLSSVVLAGGSYFGFWHFALV
jgi:hypothetical protein